MTLVDEYWGTKHTVRKLDICTLEQSRESIYNLGKRERVYLKKEFLNLYGNHSGKTVLDYGFGPGDDLVGYIEQGKAKNIIGMDVCEKLIPYVKNRLQLHGIALDRAILIHTSDENGRIELPDSCVDYVSSFGVLHHTSNPKEILTEFFRVLRPGGEGRLMVYNRDSTWFHFDIAYHRRILVDNCVGLNIDEYFSRSSDGVDCPISVAYRPSDFQDLCESVGFSVEFLGGYITNSMSNYNKLKEQALGDSRLEDEHKEFIDKVSIGSDGFPLYHGKYCGIGGSFRLVKP